MDGNAGIYVVMHGQHFPIHNVRKDKVRSRFCLVRTRTVVSEGREAVFQLRPRDKLFAYVVGFSGNKPGIHSAAHVFFVQPISVGTNPLYQRPLRVLFPPISRIAVRGGPKANSTR